FRLSREESTRAFDLGKGPLLRMTLARLAADEFLLLVTIHHIVSDGWSIAVLIQEMVRLYEAFGDRRPSPLAALPLQYGDFAEWQRTFLQGETLEGELSYWKHRLAGSPPVLELPTDRPRPRVRSYCGDRQVLTLSPTLS